MRDLDRAVLFIALGIIIGLLIILIIRVERDHRQSSRAYRFKEPDQERWDEVVKK